jgi:hypothetical protein
VFHRWDGAWSSVAWTRATWSGGAGGGTLALLGVGTMGTGKRGQMRKRFGRAWLSLSIWPAVAYLRNSVRTTCPGWKTIRSILCEAAGSTSRGASLRMPILCFGFGKAKFKSTPFVSNCWLILVESPTKSKQTSPKSGHMHG